MITKFNIKTIIYQYQNVELKFQNNKINIMKYNG